MRPSASRTGLGTVTCPFELSLAAISTVTPYTRLPVRILVLAAGSMPHPTTWFRFAVARGQGYLAVMVRYVDLSHDVHDGTVTYPSLPVPKVSTVLSREDSRSRYASGVEFFIGSIELCTNTGTVPRYPVPSVRRRSRPHRSRPRQVCRPTVDRDRRADRSERPAADQSSKLSTDSVSTARRCCSEPAGRIVGEPTATWNRGIASFRPTPPTRSSQAGVALVGIDALNIDTTATMERPAHTGLLGAGIPIVEHLTNLAGLPTAGARFTAVPVKVAGLGTFPVRAFATVAEPGRPSGIVFDCHEVNRLVDFWSVVTRGAGNVRSADWGTVRSDSIVVAFQRVPEVKAVKNRVHLDIYSADIGADTVRAEAAGATRQGDVVRDELGNFQVMLDPEGNEFCLVDTS